MDSPTRYREGQGVNYSCTMCGAMEGEHYVPLDEFPLPALTYLYKRVSKVDQSIQLKDMGDTRFDDLRSAIEQEFADRGESLPDVELTHGAILFKDEALELENQIPAIIQIGEPVEDYEFGTPFDEIKWEVPLTEDEAEQLQEEFDAKIYELENT